MDPVQTTSTGPKSAFIQHLLDYPVINAGIATFRQNDLGKKSLRLGDSAYQTFAAPVVPYLSRPYEYVSPYMKRADEIGDKTLSKVDERFPVVKKSTDELYDDAKTIVMLPYRKGVASKDHVLGLYSNQFNKAGGGGLLSHAKSLVSTVFIVSGETWAWFGVLWSTTKAKVQ